MIIKVRYKSKIYKGFRFVGQEGNNLVQIYGYRYGAMCNYNPELGDAYNVKDTYVTILYNTNIKGGKLL